MKSFVFTVDDNIRFFADLTNGQYESVFAHPYLAVYKKLHEKFGLKVQLNLFLKDGNFDLTKMTDRYLKEWQENANWLKMSFHSEYENERPYEFSEYDEVFAHANAVNNEIIRFAGEKTLAKTTTVHYCVATNEGLLALKNNGVKGLLGLFGTSEKPRLSYGVSETAANEIREGKLVEVDGITYGGIDIVLNNFSITEILEKLETLKDRETVFVMIHEQYFYPDYHHYQPEFFDKLSKTFETLIQNGFESEFFEDLI